MEKVRVGIIGIGKVAQGRHVPRLQNLDGVEITHAWSRTPSTARAAAEQFGIKNVVSEWEEIAESPDLDAVVVATPPVLHLPATIACLDAGKHVLCQARMARNLSEAHRMLEASRATDLVTSLYPPLPGLKGDRVVQRLLGDGYVGDILEVRVTAITPPLPAGWATDPDVAGVNTMTLGILAEVLNRWVGPAKSIAAASREAPDVVPQSLAISAELQNGATASFHLAMGPSNGPGSWFEIFGTKGAIIYKLFAEEIQGATESDDGLHPIEIPADEARTQTTDAEFIGAIRNGGPVHPGFEEGVRYMEFSEAVAQSLMEARTITVPPEPKMLAWGKTLA